MARFYPNNCPRRWPVAGVYNDSYPGLANRLAVISLNCSAPKVWNRFLKTDYYCGSLQVFRSFGHYAAFVLFLIYFVDEQEALTTPHRSRERDQATAGIHAQRLGSFVERFTFHCPSIDQYRKI